MTSLTDIEAIVASLGRASDGRLFLPVLPGFFGRWVGRGTVGIVRTIVLLLILESILWAGRQRYVHIEELTGNPVPQFSVLLVIERDIPATVPELHHRQMGLEHARMGDSPGR